MIAIAQDASYGLETGRKKQAQDFFFLNLLSVITDEVE